MNAWLEETDRTVWGSPPVLNGVQRILRSSSLMIQTIIRRCFCILCVDMTTPLLLSGFFFASKRQKHDTHLTCVCVWPQTLSPTVIVLKCLSYYQWIDRVWVTLALVRAHNCCIFCPLLLNCTLRRRLVLVVLSASGAGVHSKPPHQSFDVCLSGWKLIQRGPARCSTLSSHLLICLLFPILRSGTQPRVPFSCVP